MHRMITSALDISSASLSRQSVLWIFARNIIFRLLVCFSWESGRFSRRNGFDDVSVNNAIARRATLKEKKSGGTRIHSFPFRTCFSKDVRFIDAVYTIRDKQNELFRHANYNPTEYFALRSKTIRSQRQGLHMSRCRLHISL